MILKTIQILVLGAVVLGVSCRTPVRSDLTSYLPADTFIYLETQDLSGIWKVFTENRDWKDLSDADTSYLSFLDKKQAALGLIGFDNIEQEGNLQVKPHIVLLIDTEAAESQAVTMAEKAVVELAKIFLKEDGELQKSTKNGGARLVFSARDGRKIFAAVSGGVILVGNNESVIDRCLEVKNTEGGGLAASPDYRRAKEQRNEGQIAFGYVSQKGVTELSNYMAMSYALKSSENPFVKGLAADILPGFLQKTVSSIVWSAQKKPTGVEDIYSIHTEKEFAGNVFKTIKASGEPDHEIFQVPRNAYTVSTYRLEEPQIAWRGMVLSLAAQLDQGNLELFKQFSGQLLKPYGIDDPETFLSAVDGRIMTVRFDEAGDEAVVMATIKDKEKLKRSLAETFDMSKPAQVTGPAGPAGTEGSKEEFLVSRDREFTATIVNKFLILGNASAVAKCISALSVKNFDNTPIPSSFSGTGAIVTTKQRDASAVQILSHLAAQNNKSVEVDSYMFSEISIEPQGMRRRTLSAFGLLGEILKQTFE